MSKKEMPTKVKTEAEIRSEVKDELEDEMGRQIEKAVSEALAGIVSPANFKVPAGWCTDKSRYLPFLKIEKPSEDLRLKRQRMAEECRDFNRVKSILQLKGGKKGGIKYNPIIHKSEIFKVNEALLT